MLCEDLMDPLAGSTLTPGDLLSLVERQLREALKISRIEVIEAQAENLRIPQNGDFPQMEIDALRTARLSGAAQGGGFHLR